MNITDNQTIYFSVHHIDNTETTPQKVQVITSDFRAFTNKIFMQDLNAANKRGFRFARETSEVGNIIKNLVCNLNDENFSSIFEAKTDLLAEKLLDVQQKRAERFPGIHPPKKGSLVVILQKLDEKLTILLSKIDQAIFLSLDDSLYKSGLPEEKATQKTCSVTYQLNGNEYQLVEIIVTDSKPKISSFWSEDFLDLKELTSDESNTLTAFTAIENVLSTYVKRKSKGDYEGLRNNLVGYFQTKPAFNFGEMIEYVVGEYVPESEEINTETLKERLKKLPEKKDFDTAFNIVVSQVKGRFRRSYKVSDKIELRTSDYIEDLKNVIIAKEDEDYGGKILVIKGINEDLYNTFKIEED